jgi:hypothetical protein
LAYPTIQEAELHRQANRLGNFDLLSEQTRLIELLNSKVQLDLFRTLTNFSSARVAETL